MLLRFEQSNTSQYHSAQEVRHLRLDSLQTAGWAILVRSVRMLRGPCSFLPSCVVASIDVGEKDETTVWSLVLWEVFRFSSLGVEYWLLVVLVV